MYLDPQAQAIADQLAHLPRPDFSTLSVADYRAMLAAFPMPSDGDDGLASITDDSLPGPGGPLPVRIFRPVGAAPLPLTVFFHGGGFISCGIDTHTNLCSRLAALSGSIVAAVDYRLAPEHRFPAAVDDTYVTTEDTPLNIMVLLLLSPPAPPLAEAFGLGLLESA